ncbi:hypothetical protein MKW92_010103 [Papaver armeniacum]|nr:hypothetical protein MKW92_010103 [Papaver armeniacum]
MKKQHLNKVDDPVIIPPNEQRCASNDGKTWRCRNRIADTGIKWCEKHYQKSIEYRIKASLRRKKKKKLVQTETPMEKKKNGKEGNSSSECNGGLEKSEFEWKEKRKRTLTMEIPSSCCVERRFSNRLKQKEENKRVSNDDLTVNESTTTIQQITNHDVCK